MKSIISFLFFVLAFCGLNAKAQGIKYLTGAVPEIEGRVVFSKTIDTDVPIPDSTLYSLINSWVEENYSKLDEKKNRVLISNPESKQIAILGGKDLVFKDQALVLDKAFMSYHLVFEMKDSKCLVTIKNIKYEYDDVRGKEVLLAEKMITDEVALNKDGSKLNRYYDKFRIHTINSMHDIFEDIDVYLNGEKQKVQGLKEGAVRQQGQVATRSAAVSSETPTSSTLAGYKNLDADKIPDNIIEQMRGIALLITGKKCTSVTSSGVDSFNGKPVLSITTVDNEISGDTYLVAFYPTMLDDELADIINRFSTTEIKNKGFDTKRISQYSDLFEGATIIVECKIALSQSLPLLENHRIDIGQILNVWIK